MDQLILALTVEEEKGLKKRVLDRIKARREQLGPLRILRFVRLVDQTLPGLLDSDPYLVKDLFEKSLSALTKTSIAERQAIIAFADEP